MLQVIAGRYTFGAPQRRVIKIRGGIEDRAVFHGDRGEPASVEARFGFAWPVSFQLVELSEDNYRLGHLVHLAPDLPIGVRYSGRVDAEVEQRGRDGTPASVDEMPLDSQAPYAIEGRHERPVEEHELRHWFVVARRLATTSLMRGIFT